MRLPLAVLILASAVSADVVTLKDGRVLEGEVVSDDGTSVKLKMRLGTITLRKEEIESLEEKATPEQEYAERLKALPPQDPEALLELARWLLTKRMTKEAVAHLMEADRIAPDADGPRGELTRLGWHKVGEDWQDENTWYAGRGWVRWEGRWIHPVEHSWRLAQQLLKAVKQKVEAAGIKRSNAAASLRRAGEKVASLEELLDRGPALQREAEDAVAVREGEARDAARLFGRAQDAEDAALRAVERERALAAQSQPNNLAGAEAALRRVRDTVARERLHAASAERAAADARQAARELAAAIARAEADLEVARKAVDDATASLAAADELLAEVEPLYPAAVSDEEKCRRAWEKTKAAGADK